MTREEEQEEDEREDKEGRRRTREENHEKASRPGNPRISIDPQVSNGIKALNQNLEPVALSQSIKFIDSYRSCIVRTRFWSFVTITTYRRPSSGQLLPFAKSFST
jgi:hypothetical protein